jgi:hypothetical protein
MPGVLGRPKGVSVFLIAALWGALACQGCVRPEAPGSVDVSGQSEIAAYLSGRVSQYRAALSGARRWLDGLDVDPVELQRHGLKGKKKLVELLDVYVRLWQVAQGEEKRLLVERIEQVARPTYTQAYHDMLEVDDATFKQESTSYLRGALLLEKVGLDTSLYRSEILRIQGRLDAHLPARGPYQRQLFHWYYQYFGLREPFPLDTALPAEIITRRLPVSEYSDREAYELTHEIFAPYRYGDLLDADPFSRSDRRYLRDTLDPLTARYLVGRDPDLVAELVACMRLVNLVELKGYREGLSFLLDGQHEDGSFGDWVRARDAFGSLAAQGGILHTTAVTVLALTLAFDPMFNPPN